MASTEHLRAHHSVRSQQKREAVLSAARAMIHAGLTVEWVSLAARAGVSEKFIHGQTHADVKAQVKEMIAGQAGRQAERQVAEDQATIASSRAELLDLRAQLKRNDARLAVLGTSCRFKPVRSLRRSSPACLLRCLSGPRARATALELERRVGELQTLLDERNREVRALRDSLRKTIRERNAGT